MSFKRNLKSYIYIGLAILFCGVIISYIYFSSNDDIFYTNEQSLLPEKIINGDDIVPIDQKETINQEIPYLEEVTHIETPEVVKAIYMSGWVAGTETFRNSLIKMIDETELNAVVIDIKDSTGRLSFKIDDPMVESIGSFENRIKDIRALTKLLHSKNIYIIGRISVFQDPYLAKLKPEWAIKRLSDGGIWKDKKGLSFLDPTNKNVHDYTLAISLNAYKYGFDEINLDYIRYPSDGNMKDINYNLISGKSRSDNIEEFFKYFHTELKKNENIPLSADLFGLTTEVVDDMGIGQIWEKALPYFDFISPMVYPSHYPTGYNNYKNPALYPYEVIYKALSSAVNKTKNAGYDIKKIRPWFQDFDLGATYTKEMVRAQMKAGYDLGINSWMLWDPSNRYTPSALLVEKSN
jgi:hypothetical protein